MFTGTTKFAEIICKFIDFGPSTFCENWKWKLDPYKIDASINNKYQLMINQCLNKNLIIDKLLYEVQDGFFMRQVFSIIGGGTLWRYIRKKNNDIILGYYVNKDWNEITLIEDYSKSSGNMAFEYLGNIFPAFGINHEILSFHGALIEYQGNGIVISAPSGTGKTTHARLWRDYKKALIINGDKVICKKIHNIWHGFGLPWSGTSGEQINRKVPLKAFVILQRGKKNKAMKILDNCSLGLVLPNLQCPTWDNKMVSKVLCLLDDFLSNIPVIKLECCPDKESVDVLLNQIERL